MLALSGVEHLVSHMLDLHHGAHHLPMGLHGAQVGVAAVVAAAAWEMCFERTASGATGQINASALDDAAARQRIDGAFRDLDPTGRVAAECWNDYSRKLQALGQRLEQINATLQSWPNLQPELRALVRPANEIASGLHAANAAAAFDDLEPLIDPQLARWAVENCALMRNRFTVVDLLTFLGWWTPDDVTEVLERAARALLAAGAEEKGATGVR